MPTTRSAAAPTTIAPSATRGPPQVDSDGRRRGTDELGDVPRRNDHRVHSAALPLEHALALLLVADADHGVEPEALGVRDDVVRIGSVGVDDPGVGAALGRV